MAEREPDFSRVGRKKGQNKSNNVLNILISIVVVLIVVLAAPIFFGNKDDGQADDKKLPVEAGNPEDAQKDDEKSADESDGNLSMDNEDSTEDEEASKDTGKSNSTVTKETDKSKESKTKGDKDKNGEKSEDKTDSDKASEDPGSVTYIPSGDAIIAETVVNTAWQPVGTTQTGNHVSQYDGESVDWNEKKQALAYATGLPQDSMIFLKIKNGGNPQKAIGIVSSRDSVDKYRVYLEWVDDQGWQPVKMDVLNTLEFEY